MKYKMLGFGLFLLSMVSGSLSFAGGRYGGGGGGGFWSVAGSVSR